MGLLFAIGSPFSALAAIVSQWASVSRPGIGVTFFVGSIFFTEAGCLQFSEAVNVEPARCAVLRACGGNPPLGAARIDWLASAIQFAGTLCFNVNTFDGMQHGFDAGQTDLRVWTPDVFGSICFLVSSELAYAGSAAPGLPARAIAVLADRHPQPRRLDLLRRLGRAALVRASTRSPSARRSPTPARPSARSASSPAPHAAAEAAQAA